MTSLSLDISPNEGRNRQDSGPRIWLNGLAFALALGAHGAVIGALISYSPFVALPPIAIDLVPADITADLAPAQEPQQAQEASQQPAQETPPEPPEDTKQEAKTEPPETPQQTAALPEPEPPQPIAPEPAITAPPPVVREIPKPPPPKPVAKPKPKPEPKPEPKVAAKPKERPRAEPPAATRTAAQSSAAAGTAGANRPAQTGMSSAAYASIVAAALNRLKVYPAAARQTGASGSVGVSFTIGPGGRVTSSSIRSSGNGLLDAAARQMLASLRVPPPPNGVFHTGTTISFSLR